MIVLDTHVLVYRALAPRKLSHRARTAIDAGQDRDELACADISLWEVAMLIARRRIEVDGDARDFLDDIVVSRNVEVLPITPEVAVLSQSDEFEHGDPADRLIAATARFHGAALVTADTRLRSLRNIEVIW